MQAQNHRTPVITSSVTQRHILPRNDTHCSDDSVFGFARPNVTRACQALEHASMASFIVWFWTVKTVDMWASYPYLTISGTDIQSLSSYLTANTVRPIYKDQFSERITQNWWTGFNSTAGATYFSSVIGVCKLWDSFALFATSFLSGWKSIFDRNPWQFVNKNSDFRCTHLLTSR